ncbi:hypothetical protein DCO48_18105 [Pseudomonas sp. SDI]|uniref:DUF4225 domain-containing protein n=1 Tax=Pseudomonas sp. SDI TaxID=2170734 RepID=UPI000DE6529D|nr:DUF4225 domain-containing protein [Pseudomonas sp. SDI]PWB31083.1 hypothetical protein DCO48_18105 [Pseudomonas sp. SDI]
MTPRPSPYRLDNDDYWVVCEAANNLTKQACTLGSQHLQDGMLQLQFTREIAYFTKSLVNDVEAGRKTPEEAVLAMRMEQRDLGDQSFEIIKKGAGFISGALQIATGATICYRTGGLLCVVAGAPMIAHGVNNIIENGQNLWTGRSDAQGPVRKGYQLLANTLGGKKQDGNVAYGAVDIGLSIYSMGRLVSKPGAWRLFRYVKTDYVRAHTTMGTGPIMFEIGIDMMTGQQIYVELKE